MEVDSCQLRFVLVNEYQFLVALLMAYVSTLTSPGGALEWWLVQEVEVSEV